MLAGGDKLGLKHGGYHRFGAEVPLSNLFVTMMNRLSMPTASFVDSTGEMSELTV